jgi:hypothetical protein
MVLWTSTSGNGKALDREFDSIEIALDFRKVHFGGYPGEIADGDGKLLAFLTENDVYQMWDQEE